MSIKETTKRVGDVEYKIEIDYDEFTDSPREYTDNSFLCIRKHRNYNFPNELDFDFDGYDNNPEYNPDTLDDSDDDSIVTLPILEENQKLFWLDCYEHSGISFSLAGKGMQCRFDTSSECGFILAESEEIARAEIEEYNQYINGECYRMDVSERSVIEKDGKVFYSDWEWVDTMSCIGWENLEASSQFPFEEGEWEEFIS